MFSRGRFHPFFRRGRASENAGLLASAGRNTRVSSGERPCVRAGFTAGQFARQNTVDLGRRCKIPRACRPDRPSAGPGGVGGGRGGPGKQGIFVRRRARRRGKTEFLGRKGRFSRGVAHPGPAPPAGEGPERGVGVGPQKHVVFVAVALRGRKKAVFSGRQTPPKTRAFRHVGARRQMAHENTALPRRAGRRSTGKRRFRTETFRKHGAFAPRR